MGVVDEGPRAPSGKGGFVGLASKFAPLICMLHPNSKRANILKAALRRRRIANVRQLFKSGSVFDVLHWRVRNLQTKVSIIQALFKLQ